MEKPYVNQPCPPLAPLFRAAGSILLLAAASCAPPPTTASVAIPPIPPQQGRVWFYREVDTADQNTTTPYVRLNGAIAGVPEQGGAFYRDVSPGRYQITVDSEGMSPSPSRDVALVAGEQILRQDRARRELERPGIHHNGRAERGRACRDRAQQILRWLSTISCRSGGASRCPPIATKLPRHGREPPAAGGRIWISVC